MPLFNGVRRIRRVRQMPVVSTPTHRPSHVMPRPPVVDLNGPGWLRTANVLSLCGISHSTLYARMNAGTFPRPDGNDGRNYWNTSTVRDFLESSNQSLKVAA